MINLFTILISVGALYLVVKTSSRYKRGNLNFTEMIFWNTAWFLLVVIAFLPGITTYFARLVGVDSGSNLVVYVAVIVLFMLVHNLYTRNIKLEHTITKLVRELAKKK